MKIKDFTLVNQETKTIDSPLIIKNKYGQAFQIDTYYEATQLIELINQNSDEMIPF